MNVNKVKAMREEIKQALSKIESKYGVSLQGSNASYDDNSVKFRIEFIETNGNPENPFLRYENEFRKYSGNSDNFLGIHLNDCCVIRTRNGQTTCRVVGMKPNARKAPYVVAAPNGDVYRVEEDRIMKGVQYAKG